MASKKRKRTNVPVYHIKVGSPEQFAEEKEVTQDRYTYSSHANKKPPDKVNEIFENVFMEYLKHTPFEPDAVEIFRYGVLIRPRKGTWNEETEKNLKAFLNDYPGSAIHVIDEGEDNKGNPLLSIRINLGNKYEGVLAGDVASDLAIHKDLLTDIYISILEDYGLSEWFVFFETEEQLGYE